MPKPALEFFSVASVPWRPDGQPGVFDRILARDAASGMLTRMLRREPGVDSSAVGPVAHDYVEEVLIVAGSMRTSRWARRSRPAGCRPPGMVHGPWATDEGCEMLEIRYAA